MTAEAHTSTIQRPLIRRPLRVKLAILAGAFATVPAVGLGLGLMNINASALKSSSREFRLAVAEDIARTIQSEQVEATDGLEAVGRALTDASLEPALRQKLAITLVESTVALDHVSIYDARGKLIDTIREKDVKLPAAPEQLDATLVELSQARGVAVGEVLASPAGAARVVLVVPLSARQGDQVKLTGFALSQVALTDVQERVATLNTFRFQDRPDGLFVVDAKRRILAHPRPDKLLTRADGIPLLGDLTSALLKQGVAQSGEYTSARGEAMLASVVPLRGTPWVVVAQVPRAVAYDSLGRMRLLVLLVTLVAVILAIIAAVQLARRLTVPIERLMGMAGALAARNFDAAVDIQTGDELEILGHTMTRAAHQLKTSEAQVRAEQEIRQDLGRYLPKELVDLVVQREANMALGGQAQPITVLFADIVAFTQLCDDLTAPDVVALLNELFTIMTEIVFRHGGTVDKFIGDCIMAFWGAPHPQDDHAERALLAAEDMLNWLEIGNAGWQEKYGVSIELAIGINTGVAIVGNLGSETRMEYTAVGETVNAAARLEAIARPMQILITEATLDAAGDGFDVAPVGARALRGDDEPMTIFEVRR